MIVVKPRVSTEHSYERNQRTRLNIYTDVMDKSAQSDVTKSIDFESLVKSKRRIKRGQAGTGKPDYGIKQNGIILI